MAKTKFTIQTTPSRGTLSKNLTKDVDLYRKSLKITMWRALTLLEAAILIEIQRQLRRRTGALMNSISNSKQVEEIEGSVIGTIGPVGVVYAAIHEFGGQTRPHIIKPRYKKALRWVSSQGQFMSLSGRRLRTNTIHAFAKEVKHPGSKIPARPYMRPALLKSRERIAERFGLMLTATFRWDEGKEGGG